MATSLESFAFDETDRHPDDEAVIDLVRIPVAAQDMSTTRWQWHEADRLDAHITKEATSLATPSNRLSPTTIRIQSWVTLQANQP